MCRECGCALVLTAPGGRLSPPEYGCPHCDGGLSREEIEAMAAEDPEYERARARGWPD